MTSSSALGTTSQTATQARLALAVAGRQHGYFADGVVWVPLALVSSADQVLLAIARATVRREIAGEDLPTTLTRVLSERAALLVLDNFEHVLPCAFRASTSCQCSHSRCRRLPGSPIADRTRKNSDDSTLVSAGERNRSVLESDT
jgi:predicted ATPase